jgi:hypothetical protein
VGLHTSDALNRVVVEIYENGGILSAVCHGPAALVNLKLNNGQYLVQGKKVSDSSPDKIPSRPKVWVRKWSNWPKNCFDRPQSVPQYGRGGRGPEDCSGFSGVIEEEWRPLAEKLRTECIGFAA